MGNAKIKKIDPTQIRYTPQEGEVIQTPQGEFWVWRDGAWATIKADSSGISMGLYDMNKQIIEQLETLAPEVLEDKDLLIYNFHCKCNNEYYMLYGKEISYFTVFKMCNESQKLGYEVIDCLMSIGGIKAIDMTAAGDAVEIWVQTDDGPTCLYFFPYDTGLVKVGE